MTRLFYTLLIICLLPLVDWWILAVLALAGLLFFNHYLEVIGLFFCYDLFFGLAVGWLQTSFSLTIVFTVLYLLIEGYKDDLTFFSR